MVGDLNTSKQSMSNDSLRARGQALSNYTAERSMDASAPTDPLIIQAITQTMIGDYLWKYTRRVGGSTSERKHRRFFWIHPYTKTIYWSGKAPGLDGRTFRDVTAKSGTPLG
jgi:hypothetical protein